MLLGTKPGEAYTDDDGRMYYDTQEGRTYRTGKGGFGLYEWRQRGTSASWDQILGDAQWGPRSLPQFAHAMRERYDWR